MEKVIGEIAKLRTSLLCHIDSQEGGDIAETRRTAANIEEACDTLIGKYEMLCHSAAFLYQRFFCHFPDDARHLAKVQFKNHIGHKWNISIQ